MTVLDQFHEVIALRSGQRGDRQIVEDQQFCAGEPFHEPGIGAVAAGDGDVLQQAR